MAHYGARNPNATDASNGNSNIITSGSSMVVSAVEAAQPDTTATTE